MKKLLIGLKEKYIAAIRGVGDYVKPIQDQQKRVKKASNDVSNCMYYDHAKLREIMRTESDKLHELQAEKAAIVTTVKDAAEEVRGQVRQMVNASMIVSAEAIDPAEACLLISGLYTDDQIRALAEKHSTNNSMLRVISHYASMRESLKGLSAQIDDRNGGTLIRRVNNLIAVGDRAVTVSGIGQDGGSVAEIQVSEYTEYADRLITEIVELMNVIQCQK